MKSKVNQHLEQWRAGRESRASEYFGLVFGSAVVTILVIRAFLAITNYPQIGNNSLHIAHMLWGGLLLLASIIIILYFHGHRAKVVGSLVAGIGFGFFIDELGKFITTDNDYFYQPAAMLIYILFVLLWVLLNWLDNYIPKSNRQIYIDMLTRMRDASIHGMTPKDKSLLNNHALELGLSQTQQDVIFKLLKQYSPNYNQPGIQKKLHMYIVYYNSLMHKIVNHPIVKKLIIASIMISAFISTFIIVYGLLNLNDINIDSFVTTPVLIKIGIIISSGASLTCVWVGIIKGYKKWDILLKWYKKAILINIFGTQVFLFYTNQFTAAFGLIGAIVMLVIVDELLAEYKNIKVNTY